MNRDQKPLTAEQAARFHQAARDFDDPEVKMTGLTLLHTGLRSGAYAHMSDDWLTHEFGNLRIRIPAEYECRVGQNDICSRCKAQGRTEFQPKTDAAERPITVPETWTNPATGQEEPTGLPDLLNWYFTENDVVDLSNPTMNRQVRMIADAADLGPERGYVDDKLKGKVPDVVAHDLRGTYGCNLARQGVGQYKIRDLMGHEKVSTTNKYVKFVGKGTDEAVTNQY